MVVNQTEGHPPPPTPPPYQAKTDVLLPPGWEARFDQKHGRYYYINHISRTTTWNDPRWAPGVAQYFTPPPASFHGMPGLGGEAMGHAPHQQAGTIASAVSPSPSQTLSRRSSTQHTVSGMGTLVHIPESPSRSIEDLSMSSVISPPPSLSAPEKVQESIQRINTIFPTVSPEHIKDLLVKYHHREQVVISALHVAKHPSAVPLTPLPPSAGSGPPMIATSLSSSAQAARSTPASSATLTSTMTQTPGGYIAPTAITPVPLHRSIIEEESIQSGPSSTYTSPYPLFRSVPKPHSSPKMKLRYLKNVYPMAEETFLLDLLSGCDNNVQDASEKLHELGYTKRDTPIGCRSQVTKAGAQPPKKEKKKAKKKFLDGEEKKAIKSNFQVKYRDISCTVLNMALESCHYDCERTEKILNDVKNEMRELELKRAESRQEALLKEELPMASPKHKSPRLPRKSPKRHPLTASPLRTTSVAPSPQKVAPSPSKRGSSGSSVAAEPKASSTDHAKPAYVSKLTRPPLGPNPELRKGPCDGLLLHQYLVWSGPNEELRGGPNKSLHKGPAGLAKGSMGAKGPNASLARGPNAANCRGSIYRDLIMSQRKFSSPLLCSNSGTASTDENSEGGNSALPGEDSSPTPATTTTNRVRVQDATAVKVPEITAM